MISFMHENLKARIVRIVRIIVSTKDNPSLGGCRDHQIHRPRYLTGLAADCNNVLVISAGFQHM
jgi:hypothetical protein